jgi:hypothetical protein
MTLQDFSPYHSTIVGLEGIYHPTEDGYFINSSCILSEFSIIKPNQVFLLQNLEDSNNSELEIVRLLEVFYHEGDVCLYLMDLVSQNTKIIKHCLSNGYIDNNWKLIEISFCLELIKNGYEFTLKPNQEILDFDFQ